MSIMEKLSILRCRFEWHEWLHERYTTHSLDGYHAVLARHFCSRYVAVSHERCKRCGRTKEVVFPIPRCVHEWHDE